MVRFISLSFILFSLNTGHLTQARMLPSWLVGVTLSIKTLSVTIEVSFSIMAGGISVISMFLILKFFKELR